MVEKLTRAEILAQIPRARAAGRAAQHEPWWPVLVRYEHPDDRIVIGFRDGKLLMVPRSAIPELAGARREDLERVELTGDALRWDELDVDVSVPALISDWLGPRMSTAAAGRKGGSSRSRAKAAAARANGGKGGRPRKGG